MTGKRRFEEQLAALEDLRRQTPAVAIGPLRKALRHHSNYIVAKAADLVREIPVPDFIPELLAAFDRFFSDPVKTDPQCWAKNAISRALAALDFQDPEVYLRGMRHVQPEPVWGGQSDTAVNLRATCALALVPCRALAETDLLACLIDLFADKEKSVRAAALQAIAQVGSPSAALVLRARAVLAGDEPEVLGACYLGILGIEGAAAIAWLTRFLAAGDDAAAEAALAIAADRSPQAFDALRERFQQENDRWFQGVLLSAIALTRQPAAFDFLLQSIRAESPHAETAIEAILRSLPPPEIIQEIEALVSGKPRLARAFAMHQRESSKAR